jgi:hypothetical protein
MLREDKKKMERGIQRHRSQERKKEISVRRKQS